LPFCPSSDSKNIIFWPQIKTNNRIKFDPIITSVVIYIMTMKLSFPFLEILSFSTHPAFLHSPCLFALILPFCTHPVFLHSSCLFAPTLSFCTQASCLFALILPFSTLSFCTHSAFLHPVFLHFCIDI
jgi:hypothetical protein